MPDAVEQVLELVASGRITAEEAGPILDALESRTAAAGAGDRAGGDRGAGSPAQAGSPGPRYARIEVFEGERAAVNLRIPISLGRMAMSAIPGIAGPYVSHINDAIAGGQLGSVLDVRDEDGDGVRIILE